jgi:hypothetical protein
MNSDIYTIYERPINYYSQETYNMAYNCNLKIPAEFNILEDERKLLWEWDLAEQELIKRKAEFFEKFNEMRDHQAERILELLESYSSKVSSETPKERAERIKKKREADIESQIEMLEKYKEQQEK